MLDRLPTSSAGRRSVPLLALLLVLSLNAPAFGGCGGHGEAAMDMHHHGAAMPMAADIAHDDRDDPPVDDDCGDPACQAACAGTGALAAAEPAPPAAIHHGGRWIAPDISPRAGHSHPPLRPPLFS